jgi:CHAT domain-containing protein/tetratricopeptide (TPR) repeat protein
MGRAAARRCASVAAAFALVISVSAQQTASVDADAEFTTLLTKAQKSYHDHQWESAIALYETLQTTARTKGAALWEARAILGLGQVANETARYGDARKHALEALATFERLNAETDIGDANVTVAIAAASVNDDNVAMTHYERAVAAFRAAGQEKPRIYASFRLVALASSAEARVAGYAQLQPEAHAVGDKNLEGQILHAWGDSLYTQSLYRLAIEKLEAAAALFQQTDNPDDLGTTYNSLGRIYRAHGQLEAALEFQMKALKIHETLRTPLLLLQSLNAVAVVSQRLGNYDQAREYYERALAVAEGTGVATYINFITANLGGFLIEEDLDVDRGRMLLERAVAAGAGNNTSLRYGQLADAYRKLGRNAESLAAAERSVSTCRNSFDCAVAHAAAGRTHVAVGNETAALADQKEILATVEKMHVSLAPSDFLKQNFTQLWEKAYSLAIDLHFRRKEFREALEAAELARSRAFLDLLASRDLERSSGARTDSPGSTLPSAVSAAPPTVESLTAIAARLHSTLVAYWVGANNVYVWTLSPDGTVRGASVSIARPRLDELIRSVTPFTRDRNSQPAGTAIATRGDQQIALSAKSQRAWRTLYDLLIAPIEHELPRASGARLTIIPYGPLLGVPFAALRDARGRYLVERYTIHSVPAGAVLQFTADKVHATHSGPVLLIGDPAKPPRIPGEPPLPRLAGASEEVRAIARLLPASRMTLLAGSTATEPRVRAALPGKAVIHFATHGIVRDANPLASFLALGTVDDAAADGQLTADEIYGLDLEADLIVLSACRSGGGVITGDGIAGLARAFFYAGTPSVIVSVWDVADQPTSRLLAAFYRQWLNGADKATALRAAQLLLIRSLRAGQVKVTLPAGTFVLPEDPAFWAAFVLLGEPD